MCPAQGIAARSFFDVMTGSRVDRVTLDVCGMSVTQSVRGWVHSYHVEGKGKGRGKGGGTMC